MDNFPSTDKIAIQAERVGYLSCENRLRQSLMDLISENVPEYTNPDFKLGYLQAIEDMAKKLNAGSVEGSLCSLCKVKPTSHGDLCKGCNEERGN